MTRSCFSRINGVVKPRVGGVWKARFPSSHVMRHQKNSGRDTWGRLGFPGKGTNARWCGKTCISVNLTLSLRKWGASLVAQWLRIHLPTRGTRVRALVQEDPTCCGATKPVCHNYWACALQPASHNYGAREPQLLKPKCLEPTLRNKRSHRNEKPVHCNKE